MLQYSPRREHEKQRWLFADYSVHTNHNNTHTIEHKHMHTQATQAHVARLRAFVQEQQLTEKPRMWHWIKQFNKDWHAQRRRDDGVAIAAAALQDSKQHGAGSALEAHVSKSTAESATAATVVAAPALSAAAAMASSPTKRSPAAAVATLMPPAMSRYLSDEARNLLNGLSSPPLSPLPPPPPEAPELDKSASFWFGAGASSNPSISRRQRSLSTSVSAPSLVLDMPAPAPALLAAPSVPPQLDKSASFWFGEGASTDRSIVRRQRSF